MSIRRFALAGAIGVGALAISGGNVDAISGCSSGMRTVEDYAYAWCSTGPGRVAARAYCRTSNGLTYTVLDSSPNYAGSTSYAYCFPDSNVLHNVYTHGWKTYS